MSSRIEGGRHLQPATTALFVLPAVAVLIGLMGLTSGPLLAVHEARQGFEAAEERLAEYRLQSARLAELQRWVDTEDVRRQTLELDAFLPTRMEALDAFTLVRMASRASGLALESIDLGAVYDLMAEVDGETVYMQDLRIAAEDQPMALVRFVRALREGGYPTVVHDLSLARSSPNNPAFHARLEIGLLYRGPPPAALAQSHLSWDSRGELEQPAHGPRLQNP